MIMSYFKRWMCIMDALGLGQAFLMSKSCPFVEDDEIDRSLIS